MKNLLMRLWNDEEGQDIVEYALLIALVAFSATAGMDVLAATINQTFTALGSSVHLQGT